jgi:hypothetical protein
VGGAGDGALLLIGFAGALRGAELAAIIKASERGLRVTLPPSKGGRAGNGVTVAIPYGATEPCPVRALRRRPQAAKITAGAVFRRIWVPPTRNQPGEGPPPPWSAPGRSMPARGVDRQAATAGFDRDAVGGHSLKRGALTTGICHDVHPTGSSSTAGT